MMVGWPYVMILAFSMFLLGFSIFMYFEEKKFGDNQFTVKLLPPPSSSVGRGDSPVSITLPLKNPGA